jgi:hypothetical protein
MVRKFTLRRRTFNKTRYKKKNQLNRYRRSCRGGGNYLPAWLRRIFGLSDTKKTSPIRSEQSQNTGRIQRWFNKFKLWFFQKFDRNPKKEDVTDFLNENNTSFGRNPPVDDNKPRVVIKGSKQQNIVHTNILDSSTSIKLDELSKILNMDVTFILKHFKIDYFRYLLYKYILDKITDLTNFGSENVNIFNQDLTCVLEDLLFQEGIGVNDKKSSIFYVYYYEEDSWSDFNDVLVQKLWEENGVHMTLDTYDTRYFVAIPTLRSREQNIKVLSHMKPFFKGDYRVVMVDERTKLIYERMKNDFYKNVHYVSAEPKKNAEPDSRLEEEVEITHYPSWLSGARGAEPKDHHIGESFEVKGQPVDVREESKNDFDPNAWRIAEDKGQKPAWATSKAVAE